MLYDELLNAKNIHIHVHIKVTRPQDMIIFNETLMDIICLCICICIWETLNSTKLEYSKCICICNYILRDPHTPWQNLHFHKCICIRKDILGNPSWTWTICNIRIGICDFYIVLRNPPEPCVLSQDFLIRVHQRWKSLS